VLAPSGNWVGGDFDQTGSVEVGGPDSFMQSLGWPGGRSFALQFAVMFGARQVEGETRCHAYHQFAKTPIVTSSSYMIGYVEGNRRDKPAEISLPRGGASIPLARASPPSI
jgi:hypothetical protein